jgi:two-component system, LuxR family, sensor kinase FixL
MSAVPRRTPARGVLGEPAVLALEAFDGGAALVELTHRTLAWCSPGFAGRCCVRADDGLEALEARLPGLFDALDKLQPPAAFTGSSDADSAPPRARWRIVDEGGPLLVEAALAAPGIAALRLRRESEWHDAVEEHERAARRHLEDRERMLFTSRSLAVGEMASTLAHELNQPIGTVANVLRGMRARLERQAANDGSLQDLQGGVQLALEQALFAARIIARIREYTHSRRPRRDRLELGAVVRESLGLLDWEIQRDGVHLALDFTAAPCVVDGDEVMLQQLFVNLLRNALEAMRDNPPDALGRAERRLTLGLAAGRGMAVLTVRDNGCGLPAETQAQLFVPFQSTKPNGMGIGLNICRSFVELHQGRLWFTPNDDRPAERGCTFHVALPLVGGAPSEVLS